MLQITGGAYNYSVRAAWMRSLYVAIAVINASGCSVARNVTTEHELWGGYSYGAKYELIRDCFMARVIDGPEGGRYAILPPGEVWSPSIIHSAPKTIMAWRESNSNEWPYIVGVVSNTTVIMCSRLRICEGWGWYVGAYNIATVYARIQDGEYAGEEVDITDLSVYGDIERDPNPVLIKKVDE